MNSAQRNASNGHRQDSLKRVLIADDESLIADTIKLILIEEGFDATAVFSGKEAVRTAQEWQPDLFLTDVIMPDMSGIEAAVFIREFFPRCQVLLLSAKAAFLNEHDESLRRRYGFNLLEKPIHPRDLLQNIKFLLRQPPNDPPVPRSGLGI